MAGRVLFICHQPQIQWFGWVAAELRRRYWIGSVLWTVGEQDTEAGLGSNAFEEVVNLLDGFDRFSAEVDRRYSLNGATLDKYEQQFGMSFFHEDCTLDRGIVGFTDAEVNFHNIRSRWSPPQLSALAVHLLEEMERRLTVTPVLFALGEYNSLPYRLAHRLLRHVGTPHLLPFAIPHAKGRLYFADSLDWAWPQCRETYAQFLQTGVPRPLRPIAEELLNDIAHKVKPGYLMRTPRGPRGWAQRLHPRRVVGATREWRRSLVRENQSNPRLLPPELLSPWRRFERALDVRQREQYYESIAQRSIPEQPYACYFLHDQPEYTVEGLAYEYQDQVAFVRNLVASVPAGIMMAVKEHRPQAGRRAQAFYGELVSIPNVILLHDTVDSHDVIQGAALMATLTGTVALESMCAGVPCVVFGSVHYTYFRGVYNPAGFRALRQLLHDSPRLPGATREEALAALACRYASSYNADFPPASADAAGKLADALVEECRRRGVVLAVETASGSHAGQRNRVTR